MIILYLYKRRRSRLETVFIFIYILPDHELVEVRGSVDLMLLNIPIKRLEPLGLIVAILVDDA